MIFKKTVEKRPGPQIHTYKTLTSASFRDIRELKNILNSVYYNII